MVSDDGNKVGMTFSGSQKTTRTCAMRLPGSDISACDRCAIIDTYHDFRA